MDTTADEETPDDGTCSLREAIKNAENNTNTSPDCALGGSGTARDTIVFADSINGGMIRLDADGFGRLPDIKDPKGLTIDGGNANITISGGGTTGVFRVLPTGDLTLNKLTVADGSPTENSGAGGAINQGTLKVTNSTFANNSAGSAGQGGVFNNNGAHLSVTNSTFSGNRATDGGGGIFVLAPATLKNTILANSPSGGNCAKSDFGGGERIIDDGYNASSDASCAFSEPTSKNNTNPKLAKSLADNGGPTKTIALLKGSPVLNAIPQGTNGCGTDITTDQRGIKRPQGTGRDIGAFEKKVTHHH